MKPSSLFLFGLALYVPGCFIFSDDSRCGDGVVDADEACDEGNQNGQGFCDIDCSFAEGPCGDGVVNSQDELCDDGDNNSDLNPDACREFCVLPFCGDGVVDTGEVCDSGLDDLCRFDCQALRDCGDGVLDFGEGCDDGNKLAGDGCDQECQAEDATCGDGTSQPGEICYAPPLSLTTNARPFFSAVADLNGDGIQDIIAAESEADRARFFLGDGLGGFNANDGVATGDRPTSLVVVDLNGDGALDLATADFRADAVSVFFGDGAGNFSRVATLSTTNAPAEIAAADLDNDGDQDLFTADEDRISVFRNDAGTNFVRTTLPTAGRPFFVQAGDLDNDGDQDIAAANDTNLSLFTNIGGGTFADEQSVSVDLTDGAFGIFSQGIIVFSLTVGDLDGDGDDDLASSAAPFFNFYMPPERTLFFLNEGGQLTRNADVTLRFPETSLVVEADGAPGVEVVVGESRNLLGVYHYDAQNKILLARQTLDLSDVPIETLNKGDLNNDGRDDLIVVDSENAELLIFLSNP